MTDKEREILNRQIGVLEGLTWLSCMDEKSHPIGDAINEVTEVLVKLLDGGAEG